MKSPKSQLAAMSGVDVAAVKATALPVTLVGQSVRADVKKGDAAQAFRHSMVRLAVVEAVKRNPDSWNELCTESAGKTAVCVGYQAGIAAIAAMPRAVQAAECGHAMSAKGRKEGDSVPLLTPFAKLGKWGIQGTASGVDYDNRPLAAYAETLADAAVAAFAGAWEKAIEAHKAGKEADKAKKAADKAAAEAAVQAAKDAAARDNAGDESAADDAMWTAAQEAATMRAAQVKATIDAVQHGLLSSDELKALFDALMSSGAVAETVVEMVEIADAGSDAVAGSDVAAVAA